MEKEEKFQREKIGEPGYINKICWLVKALGYSPAKRCQRCESKFRHCLFFQYLVISLALVLFLTILSLLIEGKISKLVITSIFVSVIVYGYFLNKSTEKIIGANFAQRKAKEALEELTRKLKEKVDEQTKELKDAYEELKKLDKAKSEFFSIASHQLRTPLTVIKGYISLILEGTYGEFKKEAKKSLENVYQSSERLIKLVNDLLSISRIESDRMEFTLQKTSIEEIISSVVEELAGEAKKKNIYLNWEKPPQSLPFILVDKDKIRQVILNIIDNGIRYTNHGGIKVGIKSQVINYKLQIVISDTGEGMSKEELSHIFESFSRAGAGYRFWTEGSGLGLYIARKFVEMHNGRIWAESPGRGKGSTFYIELPTK